MWQDYHYNNIWRFALNISMANLSKKFNVKLSESLRADLWLFDASKKTDPNSISSLKSYLKFYGLPSKSDNLALHVGTTDDQDIFAMAWAPTESEGVAIIVHGYMDHIGLYGHLIQELLERNLTVLCFDARGHGLSIGARCSISNFSEYVNDLEKIILLAQKQFSGPLHAVGQSMGGAILIKHLLNVSNPATYPFATLNLLTPLLQPWGWTQSRRLFWLSRWFIKSIKRVFRPSSWDKEFLTFLKDSDPMQPKRLPLDWVGAMDQWVKEFEKLPLSEFPVHIIQGNHDKTLDWVHNLKQFALKFPLSTVSIIENANHHLVNESAPLRKEIFSALRF